MRRVDVTGANLSLMDYCTAGPQYASGGFIADSRSSFVINGSQQQWLIRNSEVGGWSNGVWNQVFSGVVGAPSEDAFPDPPYTTLETTPLSREKPWLYVDAGGAYRVRVPDAAAQTRGTSWGDGDSGGRTLPLSDFYVARPGDSATGDQLAAGPRQAPAADPRHLRRRPRRSTSSARAPSCSVWATRPSPRSVARFRSRSPTAPARSSPGSPSTPAPSSRRRCCGWGPRAGRRASGPRHPTR